MLQLTWVSLCWWSQLLCDTSPYNRGLDPAGCQLVVFWLHSYKKQGCRDPLSFWNNYVNIARAICVYVLNLWYSNYL